MVICVVPNVYEFNRRFRTPVEAPQSMDLFSQIHFSLFALGGSGLVVQGMPLDPELLGYWNSEVSFAPEFVYPELVTGNLCADLLRDNSAMNAVRALGERRMAYWGYTRHSHDIDRALGREADCNLWRVADVLDSKTGSRDAMLYASSGGGVRIGPALSVSGSNREVRDVVREMRAIWGELIIKPALGWGGKGSVIFGPRSDAERLEVQIENLRAFSRDGALIVEPFLGNIEMNVSPSIDCAVSPSEVSSRQWSGVMLMEDITCSGTIYGSFDSPLQSSQKIEILEYSRRISEYGRGLGYEGWLDVDFLLCDGRVYATEINARHTGGTVPILLAERLLGESWEDSNAVFSIDRVECGSDSFPMIVGSLRNFFRRAYEVEDFFITAFQRIGSGKSLISVWGYGSGRNWTLQRASDLSRDVRNMCRAC